MKFRRVSLARPRLSAVIAISFICLTVPVLAFILLFGFRQNTAGIIAILHEQVALARRVGVDNAENLIDPVAGTLRLLAATAEQNPGLFRTEESRELLYRALIAAPQVDAVYASFVDGYHRVVTRVDDERRHSDPLIPQTAKWHSSYIDAFSAGADRRRHRIFYDVWPHVVASYSVATELNVAGLAPCRRARRLGSLAVVGPAINPDTGAPILTLSYPIADGSGYAGCVGANLTLAGLDRFLNTHRASAGSSAIIADRRDGQVIADSSGERSLRSVHDHLEIATLGNIPDADVRTAVAERRRRGADDFVFASPVDGARINASFTRFPNNFGQPWEIVILTPVKDFVGVLERTNRVMLVAIILLTALEMLLIRLLAVRLSRPIEAISRELGSIETLAFEEPANAPRRSTIREIGQLQSAVSLLRRSLHSFASFVPLGLVRQLIQSGAPLSLGAEPRFLTVFFSDLEDFSTHAERLAPDRLLDQMSAYFELVSNAVSQERGTVDKFIGDGVMAFWGAPLPVSDHVLRACAGALRAARRMDRLNQAWAAEGRECLRLRVGLNCAEVLVGNFGSSERLSYTVMGDGVNVAARLEGVNKRFGTTICISDNVFAAAAGHIVTRPMRTVRVKGRSSAFMVYELMGIKETDDPELRADAAACELGTMTEAASACLERGDVTEAVRRYRMISAAFPNDPVARSLLRELAEPPVGRSEPAEPLAGTGSG
jgi:class 3 adenylate cyclase